jgi:hypothetical protein
MHGLNTSIGALKRYARRGSASAPDCRFLFAREPPLDGLGRQRGARDEFGRRLRQTRTVSMKRLREERRERRRRGCDVGGRRIWHEEALGVALDVVRVAELLRAERKGQLRMLLVDEQGGGCAVAGRLGPAAAVLQGERGQQQLLLSEQRLLLLLLSERRLLLLLLGVGREQALLMASWRAEVEVECWWLGREPTAPDAS